MIGQAYLDVRASLGTALQELAEIVAAAGGDPQQTAILDNLQNSLKDPFVFVVAGEVNVGKSTLLNALFGADFSRTGVMPTTDKILFFKHGPEHRRVSISNTLEEVHVPAEFLKDFHIVDTPGTNSVEATHQEITEHFVPTADLVIFVFSAMNPWGASAWQFLEQVHRNWMRHVIFVLQQSDLRAPEEMAAISTYMKQLCQQRFGREFPLFTVSAKKAFMARSSGIDRQRLLAESGFEALEKHISRSIGADGARVGKLSVAINIAREVLTNVGTDVEDRGSSHADKMHVLTALENGMKIVHERTLAKVAPSSEASENDFARASDDLLRELRERHVPAKAFKSLFSKGALNIDGLEKKLISAAASPGVKRWDQASIIIEDDVGRAALQFDEAVREGLRVQLLAAGLKPDEEAWKAHRERLQTALGGIQERAIGQLKLETELSPLWRKARRLTLFALLFLLLGLVGAGVCVWFKLWFPAAAAAVAGISFAFGCWKTAGKILEGGTRDVAAKLEETKPSISAEITTVLSDEIKRVYAHFDGILLPTRQRLEDQMNRHDDLLKRVVATSLLFANLDTSLRTLASMRQER